MTNKNKDFSKSWPKIVAKAWIDEAYKKKLLENPKKILKEEGIEIPTDLNIRVIEDTPNTQTLVIPPATQSASAEKIENRLAAITLP
jgi:hypothetical protein